ncbi:hypothetical protein [Coleofasciculus sp. E1-EBD-02]|uniref:hypothetical protein n=1 Tax=Coleofasciculus sp. E1-EBD-02 TaxID=3068481 RepID=UPI0032FA345D
MRVLLGVGCRVSGVRCRVSGVGCRVSGKIELYSGSNQQLYCLVHLSLQSKARTQVMLDTRT